VSGARPAVAGAMAVAGVLVCILAALGALVVRDPLDRLHFVTPVTSLGTPLVGVGVAVQLGWRLSAALVLLTVGITVLTGPVLTLAIARELARARGIVPAERSR
jgi:Multisubunit Na+/H+ antiporter, MnhG subunit